MFFYFDVINGILEPEFNPDIYSYYVNVESDVNELFFDYNLSENTNINIQGNDNLKTGDNYVFIDLEQNGVVKTYTLLVHKEEAETVFNYDEPVKLEIDEPKKEYHNMNTLIFITSVILIIIMYKIIFHKNKKQLNQ
jgi:hypothetical protein